MQKPKISIVVPVYNVERYIAECLDSCVNQTLEDIEIVVVDDCGNDKSIEIAERFARSDSRVRVIHNKENMKLMLASEKHYFKSNKIWKQINGCH